MSILLEEVLDLLKKEQLYKEILIEDVWHYQIPKEFTDVSFENLSYNSQKTDGNTLFFVKGLNFKEEYLAQAISQNGLSWYLAETNYEVAANGIIVTDIKKAMAIIARHFYSYPNETLKLIGFTGTKGKTTATYFAKHILDKTTNGKTAMLSTMNTTLDGVTQFKSELTTPESLDLFRMMKMAVDNGMTHLVMEVSSQAYKTNRVYGVTFDVGIFLNISPDHIGPIEHPTFEDYLYCKRQLIRNSKVFILNEETDYFSVIYEDAISCGKTVYVYGQSDASDLYYQTDKENHLAFEVKAGTSGRLAELAGDYEIRLAGGFNQGNALAAGIAAHLVGANAQEMKDGLEQTSVPGRMEMLSLPNGASVYVDYAHNKASVSALLDEARKSNSGKVILVIGSPGDKAQSRRKDFGEVLSEKADYVILTADDPNTEDPQAIAEEILAARTKDFPYQIITKRELAIETALKLAENENDVVVLAGKGADCYQVVNGAHEEYAGDFAVALAFIEQER